MDIANYLARITEIQRDAIANVTAVPVSTYTQGDYPYWLNRYIQQTPVRTGMGYGYKRLQITITMWLLRGELLEGEDTQLEQVCQSDVNTVVAAFTQNPFLKTETYPNAQSGFWPGSLSISVNQIGLLQGNYMGTEYQLTFEHVDTEYAEL